MSLFLAKTFWALGCIQSIEAEALGLLEPICWVREVGLNDASFEVDCLVVVDSINRNLFQHNELGATLF